MNYYELVFTVISSEDFYQDLLINSLSEIGFETFEETDFGFKAYIQVNNFDAEILEKQLVQFESTITFKYDINLIPSKNWNEVWESNFEPINIKNEVYVRATFHPQQSGFNYEIVIDPKMAFGTGHHQTTALMMEFMLENDFDNKQVLDMGCGTGILAILASKMGAKNVSAIDYDPICFESVIENSALNNVLNLECLCGSKEVIPEKEYDVILANINRNILLDQMENYAKVLSKGGTIFFSGFHEHPDLELLIDAARMYDLKYIHHKRIDEWVAAKFEI